MNTLNNKPQSPPLSRPHEDSVIELLRENAEFRTEYMNTVLADGDRKEILLAMRRIAEAFGMARVAENAQLNPTSLYRTLSPGGNPELASLLAIFSALGLKIQVQAMEEREKREQ